MVRPALTARTVSTVVCLCLVFWPRSSSGTTIDPLIWQQFALEADFIGVVECEVAGGIVANYRIIESWTGPDAGSEVALRISPNMWEPQFPIALCGERYFVMAFRKPPTRIMSMSGGLPIPLWWRRITADYELPLFQGRVRMPLRKGGHPLHGVGSEHPDLKTFRLDVTKLRTASKEQQELHLLRALAEKYLIRRRVRQRLPGEDDTKELKQLQAKLGEPKTDLELCEVLLDLAREGQDETKMLASMILRQGASKGCYARLKRMDRKKSPWDKWQYDIMMEVIGRRLGCLPDPMEVARTQPIPPGALGIPEKTPGEMHAILEKSPDLEELGEILEPMAARDPGPLAAYLAEWVNRGTDWRDKNMGYVLGSMFTLHCGKDRKAHFQTLLKAKNPYIRTAGAVYLCFEDRDLGVTALRKAAALKGDPGVWAALNLARRGDKSAVGRALPVFKTYGKEDMTDVPHRNLQKRLLVLISNSARKSGVPQPVLPTPSPRLSREQWIETMQRETHRCLTEWWAEHEKAITLHDPWLPELERQKVD